jgi:NAD(P)H-hydrate epimerase
MASGGMGDVLTGVIAALRAQGLATLDAARFGVLVHAEAARRAARAGERGMLAGDVIAELRAVVNPQ